jgi:hypothetical protein
MHAHLDPPDGVPDHIPDHIVAGVLGASPALHHGLAAFDVTAFGRHRDPHLQLDLRSRLHTIVRRNARAVGLRWERCHKEDRGDGLYFVAPPDTSVETLVGPLWAHLDADLRRANRMASAPAQLRVRMAVHAGYVHFDAHGATGASLTHLFRLLDTPAARSSVADLTLVVSDALYEDVVRYGPGLVDPDLFRPTVVTVKETHARAWIRQPPTLPGGAALTVPADHPTPPGGPAPVDLAALLAPLLSSLATSPLSRRCPVLASLFPGTGTPPP